MHTIEFIRRLILKVTNNRAFLGLLYWLWGGMQFIDGGWVVVEPQFNSPKRENCSLCRLGWILHRQSYVNGSVQECSIVISNALTI